MAAPRPAEPSPVRVAMVINSLQRGGAETQFLRVAAAFRAAGFEVRIYLLLPDDDFGAAAGSPVQLLAPRPGVATLRNAVAALRAQRPHVVVNFLYQASIVGRLAARAAGVRLVVSSVRNERLETRARGALFRATSVFDTRTVANSHTAARVLTAEHTVQRSKLQVITNGVDLSVFDRPANPTLRSELGLDAETVLFLGMGRLVPQKDWATLVRAVARYEGPPAHWAIAGEGQDRAALHALIAELGVAGRVTLLGLRTDAPDLLNACDALVLSSTYEGLPNVVLEAMAAGRPVVATRVGGCAELLGAGFGTLVAPGSPAELAVAMAALAAQDPAQRRATGTAAREHVRQNYALPVADARWVGLIRDLL